MKHKWMALCLTLGLIATPVLAGAEGHWLHVRVQEDGDDGGKVSVNLPLSVVEAILPAISTDEFYDGRIHLGHGKLDDIDLRQVLQAFQDSPDADFVTVEDGDETVRVSKERGFLLVNVDDGDDHVRVRLPLAVVDALLSGGEDELDLMAALDALVDSGGGDLITVESSDESIRVWIDRSDGQ